MSLVTFSLTRHLHTYSAIQMKSLSTYTVSRRPPSSLAIFAGFVNHSNWATYLTEFKSTWIFERQEHIPGACIQCIHAKGL